jgi:hypothetical protein
MDILAYCNAITKIICLFESNRVSSLESGTSFSLLLGLPINELNSRLVRKLMTFANRSMTVMQNTTHSSFPQECALDLLVNIY